MKTVDLFNLYMGEPRPDPSAERKIGELTVRLTMITMPKLPNWLDLQAW